MLDALYVAATGMQAQQLDVDTIANNLANLNTTAFKKSRISFTDLVRLERVRQAHVVGLGGGDGPDETGPLAAVPRMGAGVGIASVAKLFDAGAITQTNSQWDVAINGDGFLSVAMPDGSTAYTRGGTLKVNADGLLAVESGQPLKPGIAIPANATAVSIGSDGSVSAAIAGQSAPAKLGQLQLVRFANPAALLAQSGGLYSESDGSGEAISGDAGRDGIGTLRQGALEGSNVQMVDEMVNLMVAQRAYEASVKVAQASDELLGLVNNLRK
ncbi:flagellar basal-body rod protein FlgG [Trinickia diaoshuihuensis]|jgi:flagellar basal-body rod protein FlgG|uniref:flagellar basal-body rod protein FlgG n=1 Tax=Trinickia diaoshuihuensis TaxID=2292265 RepID=UPI000E23945E|nr:flagellar basal-body rod protein FlgG [Trinickia diaoshuihuensis]